MCIVRFDFGQTKNNNLLECGQPGELQVRQSCDQPWVCAAAKQPADPQVHLPGEEELERQSGSELGRPVQLEQ